jgi:hypothetical protein
MTQVVTFIVGIHILAHSVLGCCAHQGMPTPGPSRMLCCSTGDADAHRAHAQARHQCDHATDKAADARGDESSGEQHECRHESCQWLPSKADASVELQQLSAELPYQPVTADGLGFLPSSLASLVDGKAYHRLAPALRSHLRLSVLLI